MILRHYTKTSLLLRILNLPLYLMKRASHSNWLIPLTIAVIVTSTLITTQQFVNSWITVVTTISLL